MPPEKPLPIACQADPFQRATLVAFTPPAVVNEPPINKSVPSYSIASTNGMDPPVMPVPYAFQLELERSHRAMPFTATPPFVVNAPPTKMFVPTILMLSTIVLGSPPASGNQLVPSQRAR